MSQHDHTPTRLEGTFVYLRAVRPADVRGGYGRWMRDPLVNQFLESRFHPVTEASLEAYVTRFQGDPYHAFLAVVAKDTDAHIGNVKLGPIDWNHRFAEIGLLIGERAYWGRGIATEVIRLVARYAFDQLHLHKVTAGCYSTNGAAIKAFEKAGFVHEGLRKKHCYCNGEYVDQVLLGLFGSDS